LRDYVSLFWYNTGVFMTADRQTDRQTHDESIYRAIIASRGKKGNYEVKKC